MRNTSKTRDRLRLALHDLRRGLARYPEGDYPDSLFRMQLAVENGCKAILSYLGVEYGPTRFPSILISRILSEKESTKRLDLSSEQIDLLIRVASNSSALEAHGAMPRYGWEEADRIIMPIEIYDKKVAEHVLKIGVETLNLALKFLEQFSLPNDVTEILQQLREEIKRAAE